MLVQYTLAELISYGIMMTLIARAIAHRIEARSLARKLRVIKSKLWEVACNLRDGGPAESGLAIAREAVGNLALADVFRFASRYGDYWVVREQVDEAISAELEPLLNACEQNELAGPRWGLLFTSVGIVLALMSAGHQTGSPSNIELSSVALAMVNTGLGLGVAIIERSTLARHVISLANELREVSTRIVIDATRPADERPDQVEVSHAA